MLIVVGVVLCMILPIVGCANNEDYSGIEPKNFALTIKANKDIYNIGEDILINITLENRSGADIKISYYSLVVPRSATGQFPAVAEQSPVMIKKIFKDGETIDITDNLGGYFSAGKHELYYRAGFYLGWENTETYIGVSSNTIDFSIIEL